MLGKLEFSTKDSNQFVNKWFAIINGDIWRHAIVINDVCPNEVDNILLLPYFNATVPTHLKK